MRRRTVPWLLAIGLAHGPQAVLAQALLADGFEDTCALDSDGDRLSDCEEALILTDKNDADTDGDGLRDGDEVLGTLENLDHPAMGTHPRHKDLLIEHDWVEDGLGCAFHSHKPSVTALQQISAEFAAAPVPNPDGIDGIHVIHDYGQGAPFTGGNRIDMPNGTIQGPVGGADYLSYKVPNSELRRSGYFHYILHAHRYTLRPLSSGQADIFGDDVIVSMQCYMLADNGTWARNTIMHELGAQPRPATRWRLTVQPEAELQQRHELQVPFRWRRYGLRRQPQRRDALLDRQACPTRTSLRCSNPLASATTSRVTGTGRDYLPHP